MERYFFVDLENVKNAGIHGAQNLGKEDTVFIFYSEFADKLTINAIKLLTEGQASIQYRERIKEGMNALDFQIVALAASLIGMNQNGEYREYHIISEDKGYASAIELLTKEYGKTYSFRIDTSADIQSAIQGVKKERITRNDIIKNILGKKDEKKYYNIVMQAIDRAQNKDKFHQYLTQLAGQKQGRLLYNKLKDSFNRLQNAI